jgi:dihydroorotase
MREFHQTPKKSSDSASRSLIDYVLIDINNPWKVTPENILYQCGWSPLEGQTFQSKIVKTFVNGNLVYDEGNFNENSKGLRLRFERDR